MTNRRFLALLICFLMLIAPVFVFADDDTDNSEATKVEEEKTDEEKPAKEEKEEVIKEIQKRVLSNSIQMKLIAKDYTENPVPVELIYGARFMVNDRYYNQEQDFKFEQKYNYLNRLENGTNFIRLRYNPENGLLNIYCDDTQDKCSFNSSKANISQIIGYLLVEGYELSLPSSDLESDVPKLVYTKTANNPSDQYIELGNKNKLVFSLSKEDNSPMNEKDVGYIYYSCPNELKIPLTFKDDRYMSVYNQTNGQVTLYYPANQQCIVLAADSKSYRDSEKEVETGNIKFLNNYYTVLAYLKTDGGFQLRNDLIEEVYVVDGNQKFNLIPNRNRYVTERYPTGTKLTLNIKLKDGYNTITNDYYNGYDSGTDRIKVPVVVGEYTDFNTDTSDEEIEENTFRFAISETTTKAFNKEHGSTIKTIIKIVVALVILIILIVFLRSKFIKEFKKSAELKKKEQMEAYEKMFNEKADWED